MEDNMTNAAVDATQSMATGDAIIAPQENSGVVDATENNADVAENNQSIDASPTENVQDGIQTPVENVEGAKNDTPPLVDDVEQLKRQLQEYQLRDEELKNLSNRLGTNQVGDVQILQAQQQLDIVNNQAQQAYLQLCNEYGVDYRPDKIDASSLELKEKDPQKYYELLNRIQQLDNVVNAKRNEVNNYIYNKELNNAVMQYKDVFDASPAMANAVDAYIKSNYNVRPQDALATFMQLAAPVYKEAFEYGKLYAQQEAIKNSNNPQQILNNTVVSNNNSYATTNPRPFTLKEIEAMSQAEFERNEKEIDRQFRAGLIK